MCTKVFGTMSVFFQGINAADNGVTKPLLPTSVMYQLDIVLKRGNNLAIRDRGGKTCIFYAHVVMLM